MEQRFRLRHGQKHFDSKAGDLPGFLVIELVVSAEPNLFL